MRREKRKLTAKEIVAKKREEKEFRDLANESMKWLLVSILITFLMVVIKYQQERYEADMENAPCKYTVIEEAPIFEDEKSYLDEEPPKGTFSKGAYLYGTKRKSEHGVFYIVGDDTDFIPWEYVEKY